MSVKKLIISGFALLIICLTVILITGSTYILSVPLGGTDGVSSADNFYIVENGIISVAEKTLENDSLRVTLKAENIGKISLEIYDGEEIFFSDFFYVHAGNVITRGFFFGQSRCTFIIPLAALIFLVLLIWYLIKRYITETRRNLYQYKNVRLIGVIIFLFSLIPGFVVYTIENAGLIQIVRSLIGSASFFAMIALPIAFVLSILVTISNIVLLKNEGVSPRNMLGFLLGILLLVSTVVPAISEEFLQRTTLVDVHNEAAAAMYIEMFLENAIYIFLVYLECMLTGTIILGIKSARKIPSFDKDFILILGCKIKDDGRVTNLLKGRADRAVEFAKMQMSATGKKIIFVPTGGKGEDEIISEGEAVRNYLTGIGIPEEDIITENESKNTFENIRNSIELIGKGGTTPDSRIAFSTTNYHVFRAGVIASDQGRYLSGIGSKTKRYFWINAFVREFIATLGSDKKRHLSNIILLLLAMAGGVLIVYFSNNI